MSVLSIPSDNVTVEDEYLFLDASTESWNMSASVSEHPVEGGSNVVDHIQALPRVITINGTVSASPYAGEGVDDYGGDRLLRAKSFLERLQPRDGAPPTIVEFFSDRFGILSPFLCESLTFNVEAVEELTFTLRIREAIFAYSEVTTLPARIIRQDKAADVADEEDAGPQSTLRATSNQSTIDAFLYNADRTGVVEAVPDGITVP